MVIHHNHRRSGIDDDVALELARGGKPARALHVDHDHMLVMFGAANAKTLANRLKERGADLVAGGTDTHLALVDLRPLGLTGKDADESLERAGITCNKNGVPFDPLPPVQTSGIRVGSPAGTTRGFGEAEFRDIADMVADVLDGLARNGPENNGEVERAVNGRVRELCARFPIYQG